MDIEQLIAEIVADPMVRAEMLKPQAIDVLENSLDIYPGLRYTYSMTKLLDNRLNWEYRGCKIVPIACYRWSNWGKEAEPIDFGFGPRERYWRIDFPDGTWVHCMDKRDCRNCIVTNIEKHQA